jgi:hypothetical protein
MKSVILITINIHVILGKIKVAGYDALTDEEKDALFKASRRRTP